MSPGQRVRDLGQEAGVDLVDDLQHPRQQLLEQRTGQRSSASGSSVWLV
jgi:hypothetical protein